MANKYKVIRQAMRRNEVELLHHIRQHKLSSTSMLGHAWHNALTRLTDADMVGYRLGEYVVRKGARPVTAAVR